MADQERHEPTDGSGPIRAEDEIHVHTFDVKSIPVRVKQLLRKGGIAELVRGVRDFSHTQWKRTPLYRNPPYFEGRIDNEFRWSKIETYLSDDYEDLLDIGCAEGYFTHQASEIGLRATGIDNSPRAIQYAKRNRGQSDNLKFSFMDLRPDNIDTIPTCDATLLLTVYYHWVRQFGRENSEVMLQSVASKTDILFYETRGTHFFTDDKPISVDESIEIHTEYLESTFGEDIKILDKFMVPHSGENRQDPFFVIDTSEFKDPSAR